MRWSGENWTSLHQSLRNKETEKAHFIFIAFLKRQFMEEPKWWVFLPRFITDKQVQSQAYSLDLEKAQKKSYSELRGVATEFPVSNCKANGAVKIFFYRS